MSDHSRRELIKGIALGAGLVLARPGLAAAPAPVPPVGSSRRMRIFMVLGPGETDVEFGFKEYLAHHQIDVDYVIRNTAGEGDIMAKLVGEIRQRRPDLVYTWGTPQTLGIVGRYDDPQPGNFIRDIPVIFTYVAAPVETKIVPNLERPGGNVTGTVHIAPVTTQLNTLLAYREVRRIGVIYNVDEVNSVANVAGLRAACAAKGLVLVERPVPRDAEGKPIGATIPGLVAELADEKIEFLYLGPDTFVVRYNQEPLSKAALDHKLPTFSSTEQVVRNKRALMGLVSSSFGLGQFTAAKAIEILVGKRQPAGIPVETLRRFSVLINMQAAHELDFYPPIALINIAEPIL